MRWSLLGLVPVVRAGGPDITRSGAGRLAAESVWLPSVLGGDDVDWTALDDAQARARFAVMGHPVELTLTMAGDGRLQRLTLPRWGNPDGGPFRELSLGGVVEAEATFGAYTIPTRLRIGWHPDGDVFESGGEFFRVTVDEARYR